MSEDVRLLRLELAGQAGRWEQFGRHDWHGYRGFEELLPFLADALDDAGEPLEAAACRCRWQAKFVRPGYSQWRVLPPDWDEQTFRLFVPVKPREEHRLNWKRANGLLHTNAAPLLHFPARTLRLVGCSVDGCTPDAGRALMYEDSPVWLRFTSVLLRGTAGNGRDTDIDSRGYLALFAGGADQPWPPCEEAFDTGGKSP